MTENKKENVWGELLVLSLVMSVYSLISILYMPFILLLLPAPFIVFGAKINVRSAILSFLLTSLISSIFLGFPIGILYLIIFLPLIIVYGGLIKRGSPSKEILYRGTVMLFISILLITLMSNVDNKDISKEIQDSTQVLIEEQMAKLEELDYSEDEIKDMREIFELGYKSIIRSMPAILLIISFIVNYINLYLTGIGLERIEKYIVNKPSISLFRLPNNIFIGTLFIYLVLFLLGKLGVEYTDLVRSNYSLILGFIIFLQGLGVVSFRLNKRGVGKFLKLIIYILFLVFLPVLFIIYIIGLMDVFFDFRKIRTLGG